MEHEHNNPIDQNARFGNVVQQDLPSAGGILAMGIISIVFCLGIIGLVLSIIVLSMSSKARMTYNNNPEMYTASSMSRINSGRICSIVSLSLFGLGLLILLLVVAANA